LAGCGCCERIHVVTPVAIYNRPGLPALAYRVGTHGRFLATMLARLSTRDHLMLRALRTRDRHDPSIALLDAWAVVADVLSFYQERIANEGFLRTATERRSVLELARLIGYTPRPGLSATAHVAYTVEAGHQLTIRPGSKVQSVPGPGELPQTFETYEPLVARGELSALAPRRARPPAVLGRTLVKLTRLEVAGLVPEMRPGDVVRAQVGAAPVLLFQVTAVTPDPVRGTTTLSFVLRNVVVPPPVVPPPPPPDPIGELKSHLPDAAAAGVPAAEAKVVAGLITTLGTAGTDNDHIVAQLRDLYGSASAAGPSPLATWLAVVVERTAAAVAAARSTGGTSSQVVTVSVNTDGSTRLGQLVSVLRKPGSIPPPSPRALDRDRAALFATQAGAVSQLFGVLVPEVRDLLGPALTNTADPDDTPATFDRMAVRASLFGHQAAPLPTYKGGLVVGYVDPTFTSVPMSGSGPPAQFAPPIYAPTTNLLLDREYEGIHAGQTVVLVNSGLVPPVASRVVKAVKAASVSALGLTGRVTSLTLDSPWPDPPEHDKGPALATVVRITEVLADGRPLVPAQVSMDDEDVKDGLLELDGLHLDLTPGRLVVVAGERTDPELRRIQGGGEAAGTGTGVHGAELAMIASVEQRVARAADGTNVAGDTVHTFLRLAQPLAFRYRRPTVVIHGNVVNATHGSGTGEVLGAGDATKPFQRFTLKQPPLTYLPAASAVGAASTLDVRVNEVRWHAAEDLLGTGPDDRRYVVRTDDDGQTAVVFGDGRRGARLPTGVENVRATYRSGLGTAGNVGPGRISIAVDRPLGVKDVVNPLAATGGADRESRDRIRRNAPIAVQGLDRLVSVQDYADFARSFAGIGAASAAELSDGRRQLVHLTIAGAGDTPIALSSDLYRNLREALVKLGDPHEPLEVAVRSLRALVIEAGVRIDPDYSWDAVEPALRSVLLDAFGAERRDLGQDVFQAEVLSVMHAVPGVVYVQLKALDALGEAELASSNPAAGLRLLARVQARLAERRKGPRRTMQGIAPAELVVLTPAVPDTLNLSELR